MIETLAIIARKRRDDAKSIYGGKDQAVSEQTRQKLKQIRNTEEMKEKKKEDEER